MESITKIRQQTEKNRSIEPVSIACNKNLIHQKILQQIFDALNFCCKLRKYQFLKKIYLKAFSI